MKLNIADKIINNNSPAFIIAELSANHNKDLDLAKKTLKAMKNAGADAVKIQTFTPESMTLDLNLPHFIARKGTLWENQRLFDLYKICQTPREWHPVLQEQARQLGLIFFSTPFDAEDVDYLDQLNVPAFKVASPEITDLPLIEYIANLGKPIILSTGVATEKDLMEALAIIKKTGNKQIAILKCTTAYPALIEDANLLSIPYIRDSFKVVAGLSDHSIGISVPIASIVLGAKIIEKHFILDRNLGGPDASFSLEPNEFKKMVDSVREVEQALGKKGYNLSKEAKKSRSSMRSLFAIDDITSGNKFSNDNIKTLRSSLGIHPKYFNSIVGKKAKKNIKKGTPLDWNLVK
jgi:pseudaminic acid synthase